MTDLANHPTADEVLDGIDLSGRTALVTGSYSGIGPATASALSRAGARVLAPARRPDEAREVLKDVANVEVGEMDLSDQASVAAYAEGLLADGGHIDIVINNAGIMATPETRTPEGWELQFATNHLGHFALVNRLWPLLANHAEVAARVVSVSSGGHQFSDIRWDDPWFLDRLRQVERLRAVEDGQRAVRRPPRRGRDGARRPVVVAASRCDPDPARPAPPGRGPRHGHGRGRAGRAGPA